MRPTSPALEAALRVIECEHRLRFAVQGGSSLKVQEQAVRNYLSACSDLAIVEAERWRERHWKEQVCQ